MITDSNIKALEHSATTAAIAWAKSGIGYTAMQRTVNDYIEATGANRAVNDDKEAILHGRRAAATRINICAIHALTEPQEERLHDALMQIAADGVTSKRTGGLHR